MYDVLPSFVLGFHGCAGRVAEDVFAGRSRLRSSRNAYDWLGHGIYFWENNPRRAEHFVRQRRGKPLSDPTVVGAVIDLGRCLNLLDHQMIRLVHDAYQGLMESYRAAGEDPPENTGGTDRLRRSLDCAVIEYLHLTRQQSGLPPFDTVRGVFLEGDPVYPTAGFHEKAHIQICVRSPRCVKGYFRVLPDPDAG